LPLCISAAGSSKKAGQTRRRAGRLKRTLRQAIVSTIVALSPVHSALSESAIAVLEYEPSEAVWAFVRGFVVLTTSRENWWQNARIHSFRLDYEDAVFHHRKRLKRPKWQGARL